MFTFAVAPRDGQVPFSLRVHVLTALHLLVVDVHLEHDVRVEVLSTDGQASLLEWKDTYMAICL